MTLLFMPYDTETNGIPKWNIPSEDPSQPHLLQVGAALVDATGRPLEVLDVIVRPDGWTIDPETIDIHGITMERAMDEGIPEADALEQLLVMHSRCTVRIGFNEMFDRRMVRIAIKRHALKGRPQEERDALADWWNEQPHYCTMSGSKKAMGVNRVKQAEAFKFFTGQELADAHNALQDARANWTIFTHLQRRQLAPVDIDGVHAYMAQKAATNASYAAKKPATRKAPVQRTPAPPLGDDDSVGI